MEVLIVDDSTDGTTEIARRYEKKYPDLVKLIHRNERIGFKGGALNEALGRSTADYVVIFDADNIPPKDFLKVILPRLISDPSLAFVETRRTYVDSESTWIIRGMSLILDIYGFLDQRVRASTGLLAHFSGSGGIFRRRALEDVGWWSGDTLAEDLDLSVRLQLAGWKYSYESSIACLGEIPSDFASLKGQQFRWAKGYTECFRKFSASILRNKKLHVFQKAEALVHLGMYLVFPLTIVGTVLAVLQYVIFPLPTLLFGLWTRVAALFAFSMSLLIWTAPVAAAFLTLREMKDRRFRKVLRLFYSGLIMYGLLFSNTRAVIEGLIGKKSPFFRTPKSGKLDLSVR
jgi:cellulose synthase/poly-beta-1,6-N-acetylglucosamine synthase-like glycosyltransferase